MKTKLFALLFLSVLLVGLASADLGTFKSNTCVPIRVLSNSSSINLTEVTSPNQTYIINSPMTYIGGQTFNYSFCNTTVSGIYTYSWNDPSVNCANVETCGNSFTINPTGFIGTSMFYILIFVIAILILILGFYLEDIPIIILGDFVLYFIAIFIFFYGIDGIKDAVYTWAISLIILGVAIYLSVKAGMEYISD